MCLTKQLTLTWYGIISLKLWFQSLKELVTLVVSNINDKFSQSH